MIYSLNLRQEASVEYVDAFDWYEEQQEELGEKFKRAINAKLNLICNNPYHYKSSYKNFREAVVGKFPFLIVYTVDEGQKLVTIIAIFHTSRNPKKKLRKI